MFEPVSFYKVTHHGSQGKLETRKQGDQMKANTSIQATMLMLISTVSLMACGDTEDDYLEPGYGHNFSEESSTVQLAQVRTGDDQERPWLTQAASTRPALLTLLNETNEDRSVNDAFNFDDPIDEDRLTEIFTGNPFAVTPRLNPPNNAPIDTMTPEEFEYTCSSIEAALGNVDEDDLTTGTCTYDYMANNHGTQLTDSETCNLNMNKCIDQAVRPINPIAFCQTPTKVPANCGINHTEIVSCLSTLKGSQLQLAALEICDESVFTSEQANAHYDTYRSAQTCLLKLDTRCPALLAE